MRMNTPISNLLCCGRGTGESEHRGSLFAKLSWGVASFRIRGSRYWRFYSFRVPTEEGSFACGAMNGRSRCWWRRTRGLFLDRSILRRRIGTWNPFSSEWECQFYHWVHIRFVPVTHWGCWSAPRQIVLCWSRVNLLRVFFPGRIWLTLLWLVVRWGWRQRILRTSCPKLSMSSQGHYRSGRDSPRYSSGSRK